MSYTQDNRLIAVETPLGKDKSHKRGSHNFGGSIDRVLTFEKAAAKLPRTRVLAE